MSGAADLAVIMSDDKIGGRLAETLAPRSGLRLYVDRSTNWKRIARVLMRRQMTFSALWQMFVAEWRRRGTRPQTLPSIRANGDVLALVAGGIRTVFLFRAGLIVNRQVLGAGADIFNVHCASLPEYGGLGSIQRALADRSYQQRATLHRVTATVDGGPVLDVEPYALDPAKPYAENEDRAYDAGIRLLLRALRQRE